MPHQAEFADIRQANARQLADIERRLKALEDRALIEDILNATLRALEVPDA